MNGLEKAILKTLAYADIFDWPLTRKELFKFLISDKKTSSQELFLALKKLVNKKRLDFKGKYYFFPGREKAVVSRFSRQKINSQKLKLAQRAAKVLQFVPGLKLAAVTGNVAVKNASQDDDVDLMIVSQANHLWLTRLFCVVLLELFGWRRRPQDKQAKDKFCLNLWLDEKALKLPPAKQNLFIAHEIMQMQPVLNKNQTYEKFLKANQWVKRHLANS